MKKNIIFVGGIHGVGKTTICKKLSDELLIDHFSASDLISLLDSQKVKKDKRVENIQDNQSVLLEAVEHFLDKNKVCLLDGHFCLVNKDYSIQEVPIRIFEMLGIRKIILISDYEKEILDRLKMRDGRDYSLKFIKEFQQKEICYANYIAKHIEAPIKVINISNESVDAIKSIKKFLNDYGA